MFSCRLRFRPSIFLAVGLSPWFVVSCSGDGEVPSPPLDGAADAGSGVEDASSGDQASSLPEGGAAWALTFWGDIAPILNAKCVRCHQEGGIGPFPLDAYDAVKPRALLIAEVTRQGIMPPYHITHDGSCGTFEDAEALTPSELEKIQSWMRGDLAEGTPVPLSLPPVPRLEGMLTSYTTPTLAPVAQGGVTAEFDEYRCYPLTADRSGDAFITGYEVLPGNPALVHHLLTFLIDPEKITESGKTNAELMTALDQTDPDRPGWPCFGLAGEGIEIDAVPIIWAPGQGPVTYPGGIGVEHKQSHQLVVQMHYNLSEPRVRGMTDTTTVRLRHADTVERRGIFVLKDGLLETLGQPNPTVLAPGMKEVSFAWKASAAQLGLGELPYADLVGVMPHMHERGVSKELRVGPVGAANTCAAKVERWDFHWQRMYFYRQAPRLTPTDEIVLTCTYDTSSDAMPVLPGWGTRNEMCLATLMFALPPGI